MALRYKGVTMKRSSIDRLVSTTGLLIAVVLFALSGAAFYAHHFVHTQVHNQLAEQKIMFPAADTTSISSLPDADRTVVSKYAGQQLLTGAQAEAYADHFINVHLQKIGGGKTYAELSTASIADPTNQQLATQVQTVFRGETLRGLLLNAYAFDTMALVALYVGWGSLIAAVVLIILALLGYRHATTTSTKKR